MTEKTFLLRFPLRREVSLGPSLQFKLLQHHFFDTFRDKSLEASPQSSDFADDRAGEEAVFIPRQEEDSLDVWRESPVGHGDPKLIVEVRDGPEPTDEALTAPFLGVVNQKPVKGCNLDIGQMFGAFPQHFDPLASGEKGVLLAVDADAHNQVVHQMGSPFDDVEMSEGGGIK